MKSAKYILFYIFMGYQWKEKCVGSGFKEISARREYNIGPIRLVVEAVKI